MTAQKKDKVQDIINDLFASQEVLVLDALDRVRKHGNERVVIPLIKVYKDWDDDVIREKVRGVLYEIKTEKAIPELIKALEDPAYHDQKEIILATFWNAGLFPEEHIDLVVKQAITGNYMVALEVLTVVENMEGPFEQEKLTEAIFDLHEYLSGSPDADRLVILTNLHQVLLQFENL